MREGRRGPREKRRGEQNQTSLALALTGRVLYLRISSSFHVPVLGPAAVAVPRRALLLSLVPALRTTVLFLLRCRRRFRPRHREERPEVCVCHRLGRPGSVTVAVSCAISAAAARHWAKQQAPGTEREERERKKRKKMKSASLCDERKNSSRSSIDLFLSLSPSGSARLSSQSMETPPPTREQLERDVARLEGRVFA